MTLLLLNIPCWLIPLLVGVICAILGYLLGRLLGGGKDTANTENLDVYKNRIAKLEADLEACKANKKSTFSAGNSSGEVSSATKLAATGAASGIFDKAAAKAVLGKNIKQDDLTIVEGIGPKIKELFHNHEVTTWAGLAGCSVEKCKDVLKSGGKRFEMHKPGSWPEQAKMAASGQWQDLKDLQDKLDRGK
jgi:predicted flap endonuclease-1-like 5' DNA nuclease